MKQIDILIIDDEKKFADMLSKRLALREITCAVCYDGQTGLDWVKIHPGGAALVLLDLKLPDIYGTQVLCGIKEINPTVPVFIITGHGTQADKKQCLALGASEFIHKPVSIEKLTSLLDQVRGEVQ